MKMNLLDFLNLSLDDIERMKKENSQRAASLYVSTYDSSLRNAQKHIEKVRCVAFTDGLPIDEYKSAISLIDKLIVSFISYQSESLDLIMSDVQLNPWNLPVSDIENIDKRLPIYFNRRKEFISNAIPIIQQCKIIIESNINKLERKKPIEQRGFDLGLTEEQLKALHQLLIDEKFLDKNTKLNHFINAFNGEVLKDFKRLEWLKSVFGAIFLKVNFDTDSKKLKVWQNAEKIFNNGKAVSLRNADDGKDKHKDYFKKLSDIMKSLP